MSDEAVRITYAGPSTWSLLACKRLGYLVSLQKASPLLKTLLQHAGRAHPWVLQVIYGNLHLQRATPKLSGFP